MSHAKTLRISRVILPDPAWKYLLLFQSWSQLLSWTIATLVTLGIGAFAIWLAGDTRLIPNCIMAGACGGAWSLVFASKAQFSIQDAVTSEKAQIEKVLDECHYVPRIPVGQARHFTQRLPSWLRWSESDVIIAENAGLLVCTGPQLVIRKLRKALLSLP